MPWWSRASSPPGPAGRRDPSPRLKTPMPSPYVSADIRGGHRAASRGPSDSALGAGRCAEREPAVHVGLDLAVGGDVRPEQRREAAPVGVGERAGQVLAARAGAAPARLSSTWQAASAVSEDLAPKGSGATAFMGSSARDSGRSTARFDPHTAHAARVCNFWLGGKDHFPADRNGGGGSHAAPPADCRRGTRQPVLSQPGGAPPRWPRRPPVPGHWHRHPGARQHARDCPGDPDRHPASPTKDVATIPPLSPKLIGFKIRPVAADPAGSGRAPAFTTFLPPANCTLTCRDWSSG